MEGWTGDCDLPETVDPWHEDPKDRLLTQVSALGRYEPRVDKGEIHREQIMPDVIKPPRITLKERYYQNRPAAGYIKAWYGRQGFLARND